MKKILCLFAVVCVILFANCNVFADVVFESFYENTDSVYSCDLNGDGIEDSFSVDVYANYYGRYVFNINGESYIFSVVRHGGYGDVRIIDIDETDGFLDIFVVGSYNGVWGEIYRYDGYGLHACDGLIALSSESDYEKLDEYMKTMKVVAGGGKLTIECGPETFAYDEFNFAPLEISSENEYMYDGESNLYTIEVDGVVVEFDQYPVTKNDRLLVPVRAVFEKMGYEVSWDEATKTAFAVKGEDSMSVQIGNKTINYSVAGEVGSYEGDVASVVLNGRTLIPLRAVVEVSGGIVEWDETTNTAHIQTK